MKPLSLLYDEDCPLCRWYTGLFVKYGLLPETGRIAYTSYIKNHPGMVDPEISRTKIACIDNETNEVNYGIDSLLLILGQRFRWIEVTGKLNRFIGCFSYSIYSSATTGKSLLPGPKRELNCACEPTKSILWRSIFIIVFSFLTYLNINWFLSHFLSGYLVYNPANVLLLLLAQLAVQWGVFRVLKQKNSYDYLGHLTFVSFLGSLLLLFFGLLLKFFFNSGIHNDFPAIASYGATLAFIFLEHKKRIGMKGWTNNLSFTWVAFRLAIYPFVFQL